MFHRYRRNPRLRVDGALRKRPFLEYQLSAEASAEEIKEADRLNFARELVPLGSDPFQNDGMSWQEILRKRRLQRIAALGINDQELSHAQTNSLLFQREMGTMVMKLLKLMHKRI